MQNQWQNGPQRAALLGLALLVAAGCNADGSLGSDEGRVRVVLSRDGASPSVSSALATDPAANWSHDDEEEGVGLWTFTAANVTMSSILARSTDGVLVNTGAALPVAVDVMEIDEGRTVQLPDGTLPVGSYDQVVIVITAVQGIALDGTAVTVEPPGGGWTAVVPICALDVEEGSTATVALTLNVRNSFLRTGTRWSFQPRFKSSLDCGEDEEE